ncbi:MAG: transcriptional regulator [Candidatus Marinimicrobia bacterium]|nr:transcriptional regulator [Candidatus Neomarinimicrobiota bacterium]MAR29803.1 transcriptional regulator [Candidatus Neomarinimicrobiota bacterium]|tara:strand:- start:293 stop:661 length:369 start_codon:yes stop_codon:yes gene_type:complete
MELRKIKKLYYSIGQVSELTGLKQYVLRYWETEFQHLKPNKNSAGNRVYTPEDVENIKEVKRLLHEEKFTIKGARQHLKDMKSKKKVINIDNMSNVDVSLLKKIQSDVEDLLVSIRELKKEL